jgi:hypothetical protein
VGVRGGIAVVPAEGCAVAEPDGRAVGVRVRVGVRVGVGVGRRVTVGRGVTRGVGCGVPGMTRASPALERPPRRIG